MTGKTWGALVPCEMANITAVPVAGSKILLILNALPVSDIFSYLSLLYRCYYDSDIVTLRQPGLVPAPAHAVQDHCEYDHAPHSNHLPIG